MKRLMKSCILLVVLVSTTGWSQTAQPMIGMTAPDFSLKDLDGNVHTLPELRGNFVIIHFAASW